VVRKSFVVAAGYRAVDLVEVATVVGEVIATLCVLVRKLVHIGVVDGSRRVGTVRVDIVAGDVIVDVFELVKKKFHSKSVESRLVGSVLVNTTAGVDVAATVLDCVGGSVVVDIGVVVTGVVNT
jgi:hypothetical protein